MLRREAEAKPVSSNSPLLLSEATVKMLVEPRFLTEKTLIDPEVEAGVVIWKILPLVNAVAEMEATLVVVLAEVISTPWLKEAPAEKVLTADQVLVVDLLAGPLVQSSLTYEPEPFLETLK